MKNNFKQQFEDSQANFSQMDNNNQYQNPGFQDNQQGFPIQLARIKSQSKQIQLDQKALDIIASCDLPVGFTTFVGKYRIGKSCLLNRMLGLPGLGFKVSPTVNQCTKGIWMWSKPFYSAQNQCYIFFVDTQGIQALSKQPQMEIKLFTLNCLLSTYLVFNSVGSIDQRSIQQLNLVTSLSKNVLISSQLSHKQNEQQLYQYMPKFLWLLRDFTLQLKDSHGRPMSPKQYLENCLSTNQSQSLMIKQYGKEAKKIKNQIVKIFKDRDCMTLVRPVQQQRQLQKLNDLPDHALRRQYITGINKLKETIFKNCQPKYFQNQPLFGGSVVSMLEAFVQSMNNGGLPKIKSAWQQIAQDQGAFAYNRALQRYNEAYGSYFTQDEPFSAQVLHDILADMREIAMQQFNKSITHPNQTLHIKLKQYLKAKQKNIIEVNKQLTQVKNVQILKDLSMPLMKKIQSGAYKNKNKTLTKDIDDLVKLYNSKAVGETKGDIISQFLTTLNPIIISIAQQQANKQNINKSKAAQNASQQLEKRQKLLQQQLNAMKEQMNSKDNMLKKRQKQLKQANEQLSKKKQTKGCCQIM